MTQQLKPIEDNKLPTILKRFHPVVGEGLQSGKWSADFLASGYGPDSDVVSAERVKDALLQAGVAEGEIVLEPLGRTELSSVKSEAVYVTTAGYVTFKNYVNSLESTRGIT